MYVGLQELNRSLVPQNIAFPPLTLTIRSIASGNRDTRSTPSIFTTLKVARLLHGRLLASLHQLFLNVKEDRGDKYNLIETPLHNKDDHRSKGETRPHAFSDDFI